MNRASKLKEIKPVRMWGAVSEDVPPEIWQVGFYKDDLQSNLRKVRVLVTPLVAKRPKRR